MGKDEIECRHDGVLECENCGNEISFRISGFEYPIGAFDYEIEDRDFTVVRTWSLSIVWMNLIHMIQLCCSVKE